MKSLFLMQFVSCGVSIAQAEFFTCCKTITGLGKNVFFVLNFHVPRNENHLKNAPLLGVFQSAKTCNLWALLIRSESALLGNIFIDLCCYWDEKYKCKNNSTTPSRLSLRAMWICTSFQAVERKPQFYFLLDFSKSKALRQVLVSFSKIIPQRDSPGKIWRNP